MERQEGYYWVRLHEHTKREIAYYNGKLWRLNGHLYSVVWIADLPENRLTPPNI